MTRRSVKLLITGAAVLLVAYFGLPPFLEKLMTQAEWEPASLQTGDFPSRNSKSAFAPVALQWLGELRDEPVIKVGTYFYPASSSEWSAVNLNVVRGQACIGGEIIPHERVVDFINARSASGANFVIVTQARGTKWGEMFPVLDACRRSSVRAVIINRDLY
jgi:hypothetical protein